MMNNRRGVITLFVLVLGAFVFGLSTTASAQGIAPIFPGINSEIRFQQLVDEGFQWTVPPGTTKVQIRIFGPDSFLSQEPISTDGSPLKLNPTWKRYFYDGSPYQWRVEIIEGTGAGTQSDTFSFKIMSPPNPTPTPLGGQERPTPSGDLDGSATIDARDILIFARHWKQSFIPELDLSQDGTVDLNDVLLYADRYQTVVPKTDPMPAVGLPRNIRYSPSDEINFAETMDFVISWDPPSYPSGGSFTYEITIKDNIHDFSVEKIGLTETSLAPFSFLSLEGTFFVYLKATTASGFESEIAVSEFNVINRPTAPTPTPIPLDPDLTRDGQVNSHDIALFTSTYGRQEGQFGFNTLADYRTDGIVNEYDLLLFRQLIGGSDTSALVAPIWESVVVQIMEGDLCSPTDQLQTFDSPSEVVLGISSNRCALAELFFSTFTFTEISDASRYFITLTFEIDPEENNRTFFVESNVMYQQYITTKPGNTIYMEVQAVGENLELGSKSAPLKIVLPTQ